MREAVRLHGVPSAIISDRGSRFTSEVWKRMCDRLNTTWRMSTPDHPQTDGLAERTDQTIKTNDSVYHKMGNEGKWVEVLPMLEFAYNSSIRPSTQTSPFEMLYGFVRSKPVCKKYRLPTISSSANLLLQAEVFLQKARIELEKAKATQCRFR